MKVSELRQTLERAVCNDGKSLIFRPTAGGSFVELHPDIVLAAFDEIVRKVPLVQAEIVEPSAADKLLWQLFVIHGES